MWVNHDFIFSEGRRLCFLSVVQIFLTGSIPQAIRSIIGPNASHIKKNSANLSVLSACAFQFSFQRGHCPQPSNAKGNTTDVIPVFFAHGRLRCAPRSSGARAVSLTKNYSRVYLTPPTVCHWPPRRTERTTCPLPRSADGPISRRCIHVRVVCIQQLFQVK